jgi:hypothetical protein
MMCAHLLGLSICRYWIHDHEVLAVTMRIHDLAPKRGDLSGMSKFYFDVPSKWGMPKIIIVP